jgi:hypothetical protein
MDWSALLASIGFLALGFMSLRLARDPHIWDDRFGSAGTALAAILPALYSLGCMGFGAAGMLTGTLWTPTGTAWTGVVAIIGGFGFIALGAGLLGMVVAHWRPAELVEGRGMEMPEPC